jgi:hypothetical protein
MESENGYSWKIASQNEHYQGMAQKARRNSGLYWKQKVAVSEDE